MSPAGGTSPRGLPSSPSTFPLTPRPDAPSPFLSPLHISKIPAHRSAFFTGLTTFFFCTSPPFLWGFHSFFCPDTNFHTPIQGNGRNVSVPAASCCCCTYGHNRWARGARVFLQGPRMDGWIDTGIEWLMKKRGQVHPALNGSIPAPTVNKDVLILLRKSVFFHVS